MNAGKRCIRAEDHVWPVHWAWLGPVIAGTDYPVGQGQLVRRCERCGKDVSAEATAEWLWELVGEALAATDPPGRESAYARVARTERLFRRICAAEADRLAESRLPRETALPDPSEFEITESDREDHES